MEHLFSLKDKIAVVSGACGLIGKKHLEALSSYGAFVVGIDILTTALEEEQNTNENILYRSVDITNKDSLETICEELMDRFGKIDILVNNAGINDKFEDPLTALEQSKFEEYPLSQWQLSLDVNITGVFLSSQVFGKAMLRQNKGNIINVASTYGMVGPDQDLYLDSEGKRAFFKSPSYPVTKAAVLNFTRYLAAYWGQSGIRVNSLSPGGVENGQDKWFVDNYSKKTCLKRMAKSRDFMGALIFLASDASEYMTGANLVVDGGWTAI